MPSPALAAGDLSPVRLIPSACGVGEEALGWLGGHVSLFPSTTLLPLRAPTPHAPLSAPGTTTQPALSLQLAGAWAGDDEGNLCRSQIPQTPPPVHLPPPPPRASTRGQLCVFPASRKRKVALSRSLSLWVLCKVRSPMPARAPLLSIGGSVDESDEELFTVPDLGAEPGSSKASPSAAVNPSGSGGSGGGDGEGRREKVRRGRNPQDREHRRLKRWFSLSLFHCPLCPLPFFPSPSPETWVGF